MKIGDLVRHKDGRCGIGRVLDIATAFRPGTNDIVGETVLVRWPTPTGNEWCDEDLLELVSDLFPIEEKTVTAKRLIAKVGTVEIDLDTRGKGKVLLDGQKVACRSLVIQVSTHEPPVVTLELYPMKASSFADSDTPTVREG